ncbi:hypothetical protein [Bradyrhizobium sp.]
MSAIAEGLFQQSRSSHQTSHFAVMAPFLWAASMLFLALAQFGVDFSPPM